MLKYTIIVEGHSPITKERLQQSAPLYLIENLDRALCHVLDNMEDTVAPSMSFKEFQACMAEVKPNA